MHRLRRVACFGALHRRRVRLKLDENLGRHHAEVLRAAGHDISTVYEHQLTSATDVEVFAACQAESRILVTFDMDFANPFHFDPTSSAGVAVLRIVSHPTRGDLEDVIGRLIRALAHADPAGRLWIVEIDRVRQYEPG